MSYSYSGRFREVKPYMANEYPLKEISEEIREKGHGGRYRTSVYRRYGLAGFDTKGRILQSVINEDKKSENVHIRKMANLAKTYHKVNVGRKSFKI